MKLRSLEELPLHQRLDGMLADHWWACDYPERPSEPEVTWYDMRCPACRLAAEVSLRNGGTDRGKDEGKPGRVVSIRACLSAAAIEPSPTREGGVG